MSGEHRQSAHSFPPGSTPLPTPFFLASTSRWRQDLLAGAGIACEAVDPGVDEGAIEDADPVALARARALAKARAVARGRPGAWVLGADQVAHLDGDSFGKPLDDADWRARLRSLRGQVHTLSTGVALIRPDGAEEVFHVDSRVGVRADLSDAEIDTYIAMGEARGCAGGYMVERRGAWLIGTVDGDWTNVLGLPVLEIIRRLRAHGWILEAE